MRWIVVSILLACSAAAQTVQLSLPLQGYYRAGQYMPVRVTGTHGEIRITAPGAVPTVIAPSTNWPDVIVPLLIVTSAANEVTAQVDGQVVKVGPLHALSPDERLVGITEGNEAFARSLLPDKKVITVSLDSQFPNPAAVVTWDALDAVVVDLNAQPFQVGADDLLANGTIIAVKGAAPAESDWKWEQRDNYWVLDRPMHGPAGAEIDLDNYSPSYGLEPEESLPARQLTVITGALFALLVVGSALLLRPRAGAIVIVLLSIATIAGAVVATMRSKAKQVSHATIEIFTGGNEQSDNWSYVRSWRQPARYNEPAFALVYPMLASESQIQSLGLQLRCAANGAPESFVCDVPPHNTIAWMQRSMRGNVPKPEWSPTIVTPFTPVLNEKYLTPNVTQIGHDSSERAFILQAK